MQHSVSLPVSIIISIILFISIVTPCLADNQQAHPQNSETSSFADAINALNVKSFKLKATAIKKLAKIRDKRTPGILTALLESNLFYRNSDKLIVIASETENGYSISNAITGDKIGTVEKHDIKKIRVNNKLRKQLRNAIAQLSLASEDMDVRLNAVSEMTKNLNQDTIDLLRSTLNEKNNNAVKEAIELALAFSDIYSEDKTTQLKAISLLGDSLSQEARNKLSKLLEKSTDDSHNDSYKEKDIEIRNAVKKSLKRINSQLDFYALIEKIFFGLSLGSVLLLAAIGLAITFGVMGVINMAHGELIMLGAYTTYVIQLIMPDNIALSLLVAIPAAFIVSGLFGIAIERGVIRFLYGRPLETLLATFGISLVLQQLVRSIFSPLNRSVETPAWMSGSLEINSALSLTYNRLYILLFSLIVFFALMLILKKTTLGLKVRAVSQNRAMAKAMGTRAEWVDALTFGLGSGIAGVAGVALSQLTNVGPNLGQSYIIDSFMVVVFGGVGNLWGTLVGAMSLGVVNKFLEPWAGAVLAKILVLIFIILFIQKRPRGLFPQKGRATEN